MFDRFIKFLYYLGWYCVGMATFSYATRLSDLLENDNLLRFCKICEDVLIKYQYDLYELDDRTKRWEISFYLGQFLGHNDRDFLDCCRIFHFIKTFKHEPLSEEEDSLSLKAFQYAFRYFIMNRQCCIDLYFQNSPQEDINFLNSLFFVDIMKKLKEIKDENNSCLQSNSIDTLQTSSAKIFCTFL